MVMASIHNMELKDLEGVHSISGKSFKSPWSLDAIQSEFYNEMAHYLVARQGDETVGFLGTWLVFDEVQITNIAVDPACRRQGIAHLLLDHLLLDMKNKDMSIVFLEVRISNEAAKKLYEAHGFHYSGYRKKFYPDGEDAYLMSRDLS